MNTRLEHQTILWGIVAALAMAILFGAKAVGVGMAIAVGLLLLLLVVEGGRIARQELSDRQPTDAILTVVSYLAGALVLVVGLLEVTRGPSKAGRISTHLVGLALVMLLLVFFFGLMREGCSVLKTNLAKRRTMLAIANVVILLAGGFVVLAGVRKLAQIFLHG